MSPVAAAAGWRAGLVLLFVLVLGLWGLPAQAHLMVAQTGTLNLAGQGAYLVLSLPVSALRGVDDNGDGALGLAELRHHAQDIEAQVRAGIVLSDARGHLPLQGLMLNLASPDHTPAAAAQQLVVMGRFALDRSAPGLVALVHGARPDASGLTLRFTLYGTAATERQLALTVTRRPDAQVLRLTPEQDSQALLPSAWTRFLAQLHRRHDLGGWQPLPHLLVMAVAVAMAGLAGWRRWAAMRPMTKAFVPVEARVFTGPERHSAR